MAKLLLLLQLLLAFVVTVSGVTYNLPPGCSPPNCLYTADVTMNPSGDISVVVNAKQAKPGLTWTGIGFSKEKNTKHMDLVYGGSFNGKPIHVHGVYETGKKLVPLPPLPNKELTESSGRLIVKFTHPVHGLNPKDISFPDSACYYLVFPTENGKMLDDKGTVSLESSKILFSDKPLCVKDLKTPTGSDAVTKPEGQEVYPPNCKDATCTIIVKWKPSPNKKAVWFQVVAKQEVNTYTGLGFSLAGKGKGSINAVLGYRDKSGKTIVTSGNFLQGSLEPKISNSPDILNPKLSDSKGAWVLEFELRINPESKDGINLSKNPYYLVLFPGGGKIGTDSALGKLLNQPQYSVNRIRFVKTGGTLTGLDDGDAVAHHIWTYNCKNEEQHCQYKAFWVSRNEVVDFTVIARLPNRNTYTGIGLTSTRDLSKVDFIYVKKLDDLDDPKFHHGLITNGGSPVDYPGKSLVEYSSYVDDDRVVMTFSHKREPLDVNDFSLAPDKCYHLIFPYEGGDLDTNDLTIVKLNKYYTTEAKICFTPSTPDIFGPPPLVSVTPPVPRQTNKRMCYFANWAPDIPEPVRFLPSYIDPFLCSHIVYCFAWVKDGRVVPTLPTDEGTKEQKGRMQQINGLKQINPDLKTLLAIGGDDMDINEMTEMLVDEESRSGFIRSTIRYLRTYGFDGVNLMFKYPGWSNSPSEDKDRFQSLLSEMRAAFRREIIGTTKHRLQLSVSVSVLPEVMEKSYYVKELSREVDCIQLMTFDLHGSWENVTRHHSALYPGPTFDPLSVESIVKHWTDLGAEPEKLVVGIALYGRGGVLEDPGEFELGSRLTGPSPAGKYTRTEGLLAYYEICVLLKDPDTELHWIEGQDVPYLVYRPRNVWMGYDDERSVHDKAMWLREKRLGGYFVWITHFDDFKGTFCNRKPYPLIRTLSETLVGQITRHTPTSGMTNPETTGTDVTILENTTVENSGTAATVSTSMDMCESEGDGKRFPIPGKENCRQFIECTDHVSQTKPCTGNLYFNPKTNACTRVALLTPERKKECGL